METALVVNPAGMGDKRAIAAIRDRIMTMIPGALDAPPDVVWAAAQLAVSYRLDPFNGEIYIMKLGRKKVGEQWVDDYRAHVGVKGLRKKAREQAQFMTDYRDLSEAEVKAARRADYDTTDVGVECTLYRMDIAQQCQRLGIPYKPFRATGFWRGKAKKGKDGWEPDNIPNTWTAHDVAEKRAEINAIKRAYDLTINVADPAMVDEDEAIEIVGSKLERAELDQKPAHRVELKREEDGDCLFYEDEASDQAGVDLVEYRPAAPATPGKRPGQITRAQLNTLHALGVALYGDKSAWDAKRPSLVRWASKKETDSSADLSQADADVLIAELKKKVLVEYERIAQPHVDASNVEALVDADSLHGVELANALNALRKAPVPSEADNPFEREAKPS